MTFGAVFAAILAVVAAAEEPRLEATPEEDVAEASGESAPADADAAEAPGEAAPAEADAAEAPADPLAIAPAGHPLADSGALLIDRTERAGGWAIERLLEPSGDIVEHEVNRAGTVQSCRRVGSLFALRVVEQRRAAEGEFIEVVRDASGALLRLAVGPDGEPRAVALLAPPPR